MREIAADARKPIISWYKKRVQGKQTAKNSGKSR